MLWHRAILMVRQFLQWFFRNRKTGAITIAQRPNVALWIVILAAALRWLWTSSGRTEFILKIVVQGGLFIWAVDEMARGVNPWRRCLGASVAAYQLSGV